MKRIFILLMAVAALATAQAKRPEQAKFINDNGTGRLMADGRPWLILGG